MFDRLGAIVSRYWILVLGSWVVLVAGIHLFAPRWDDVTHDGDFAYLPAKMTSVQGEALLDAAFPDVLSKSQAVLVLARADGPLQPADYAVADSLLAQFTPADKSGPIVGVLSHRTEVVGEKLVSEPDSHGQALLVILQLRNEFMAVKNMDLMAGIYQTLLRAQAKHDFPAGLQLGVTGSAAIGADMLFSAEESIRNTEVATILLVVFILLLVYRAPGLVAIPLIAIVASVVVAMGLVALLTRWSELSGWFDFKVFKTTKIFVVVILFGAGVDYCLFLVSRYREELEGGSPPGEAIARALGRVGDALAASALTTIVGLGAMVFADFGKFRNSGPAIALCLMVALVASVTLAPALLRACGRAVFWPLGLKSAGSGSETREGIGRSARGNGGKGSRPGAGGRSRVSLFQGFWEWLSRRIIARPGLILVVAFLLLAPMAFRGFWFDVTYDLLSELRSDCPSVRGTHLLRRYFPAGEIGPVIVLAHQPDGGFESDEEQFEAIQSFADDLYRIEYRNSNGNVTRPIASVRSLLEPLGEPPRKFGFYGAVRKGVIRGNQRTKNTYLAQAPEFLGKVTRFDLVLQYDPFSVESIRLLDFLRRHLRSVSEEADSPWSGTTFHFVGTTAGIRDLKLVTARDRARIQILVPIAVLFVLIAVLRRPLICVYLILSVLFGYFVTIGTTELVFSWLHGNSYTGLDWKVPIFLFVILIAVGQDYNVYLATRVFEEQQRHGPEDGLRVALVRTGGIITSCGLIMAGTFASMTAGTLRAMHELGFALSLGVLLDTFIIRTVLVPAFLVLWNRCFPLVAPQLPTVHNVERSLPNVE